MHELAIVENIVKVVCDKLDSVGGNLKVSKVKLKVGKMSTAVPDCLRFYFEHMRKGTPMETAVLEIDEIPVTMKCRQCGNEFKVEEPLFLCPSCQASDIEITGGRDLFIESIVVED
jgi:hydrogenase nickel incorporation protein HypA/HybF